MSPENRLRRRTEFTDVVRRGRRASRPLLTVHLLAAADPAPARAGLVISKAVGGSVVRSRVARQLRHLLREVVPGLPPGSRLVVRAAPSAADAGSAALDRDLRSALDRLVPS
ncbi:MAG: ribonuclease P protein component [Frankiaceae bacterium]|nr:ribonuclease P protein component [Frankiaceae bacterium]